jgi:uncharacterized protein YjhX (UPF0386 family)
MLMLNERFNLCSELMLIIYRDLKAKAAVTYNQSGPKRIKRGEAFGWLRGR